MSNEEVNELSDIIIDSIMKSNLSNYTKLEIMMNLRLFFENYNENINILNKERKKKYEY